MSAESPCLFPVTPQLPLEPVSGKGARLRTRDGREFDDFYGGHAVCGLGYDHPAIRECLARAEGGLFFQTTAVPHADRARAAEALVGFAPEGLDRAFFVNSGAEANENALRLAFATARRRDGDRRPPRDAVVALSGGFHGRMSAAAAVTDGSAKWYGFPRAPFEVRTAPRDDPAALAAAVDERVAAVILEPVQGMAGAVPLDGAVLAAAREAADAAGALLVFDEVQCGMGRTGRPFAGEWSGVRPDLLTAAKSLAAGFPAGAVLASEAVAGGLPFGAVGTTFGGGPVAGALIAAVVGVLREEGFLEEVLRVSERIRTEATVGPVTAAQGRGLLLGLVCSRPAREVRDALLGEGVLVGLSADPAVVRLMPPLVVGDDSVDRLVAALARIPA